MFKIYKEKFFYDMKNIMDICQIIIAKVLNDEPTLKPR